MKAVVISKPGGSEVLKIEERPIPEPNGTQVRIKVRAAGVNRPDIYQRKGNYPPPAWAPVDIPGLEVAGVVDAIGDEVGERYIREKVCALVAGGGYAEYVLAEAGHCLPVPENLTFAEAASLPETVFTVWHNVFERGFLKKDEHFLVHGGSSGIGITAIQLAKLFGAKVFATAGTDEKCEACVRLGADICVNYREQDFETILKPIGLDVILDMVGGEYIPKNLNLLKPDGRLVFINTMTGAKMLTDFGQIVGKRLTVTGSTLRNRDNAFKTRLTSEVLSNVWPLIRSGSFKPLIFKTFTLGDAELAHEMIESSSHIGKIVLEV